MVNIKKIALALLIAAGSTGIAQAGPFSFGIKAGLNVNKLSMNKEIASPSNSCGWTAGVMVDFTVPIIGIAADASVMYARMNNGATLPAVATRADLGSGPSTLLQQTATATSSTNENPENLYGKNFIEIPINIKYKFTIPVVASIVKPYIFTGPQFGLRLDKESVFDNLKSRTFQMNWNVGLGVELINHLQVGASYGIGCNSIVEKLAESTLPVNIDNNGKIKNNYWTVTAAWLF